MGKARPRKKGYRQGHLKRFHGEAINAGQRFNPKLVGEHYDVFNARARAKSIADCPVMDYSKKQEHFRQSAVLNLEPEDVVLVRLKGMWQTDFWQGVYEFRRQNIYLSEQRNLFLFFHGKEFFFVAEYPLRKEVKRSVIYHSREVAFMHMDAGKICWIHPKDKDGIKLDALPRVNPPKTSPP